jgi:3'-phosphoadenosine 5'-phosphosulfate sulfotransferase (PAPS reductase)/FAD synthetase
MIIVPVSGGKDSQLVLQRAIQEHGIDNLIVVHQFTGYDHPLTNKHLEDMEAFYKVKIHFTKAEKYGDIFDLINDVGYFPSTVARVCTLQLKQLPFAKWLRDNNYCSSDYVIWMGMRKAESSARGRKYADWTDDIEITLHEFSAHAYRHSLFKEIKVRLPIVDMTDAEVFEEIEAYGAPINPLYASGHKRVGCYPCLLARAEDWRLAANDTYGRENIQKLIDIEDRFHAEQNPRKLIKIHQTRDVRKLLADGRLEDDEGTECGWCSI